MCFGGLFIISLSLCCWTISSDASPEKPADAHSYSYVQQLRAFLEAPGNGGNLAVIIGYRQILLGQCLPCHWVYSRTMESYCHETSVYSRALVMYPTGSIMGAVKCWLWVFLKRPVTLLIWLLQMLYGSW